MSIFNTPPSDTIYHSESDCYKSKAVKVAVGLSILSSSLPAFAGEPADTTVDAALDMIVDLDTIAIAAFAVCLTPFAAMTTLRFLNMVLGRV